MAETPGDEQYTDADNVGFTVNGGGNAGDVVEIVDDMTVEVTSAADQDVDGVLLMDAEDGEDATVNLHGAYWTSASDAVTASDYLTPGDTAGQLRPIDEAGGETPQSKHLKALTTVNSDGFALVHYQ